MKTPGEGGQDEGKRLLELVAFAQRERSGWRFTWRHGVFFGLAALSLFAALRTWTTWRSFHRPIEVQSSPDISAVEQGEMIAAIRASHSGILDPVAMDAATFRCVFLGQGRIERTVRFVREGGVVRADVCRRDGGRNSKRRPMDGSFTFDRQSTLKDSSVGPREMTIF